MWCFIVITYSRAWLSHNSTIPVWLSSKNVFSRNDEVEDYLLFPHCLLQNSIFMYNTYKSCFFNLFCGYNFLILKYAFGKCLGNCSSSLPFLVSSRLNNIVILLGSFGVKFGQREILARSIINGILYIVIWYTSAFILVPLIFKLIIYVIFPKKSSLSPA